MTIFLKPELERRVVEKVHSGEYPSPEAFIEEAVEAYLEIEWDAGELQEDREGVCESIGQLDRREGISLEEFEAQMREKHGISR
jgi:Arc/MetJ-type ribon-helix-helix transcriptional regulator